jgi:hypothetical protein
VNRLGTLLFLAALVVGCTQGHYLVRSPDLPLYSTRTGDQVLARLPRFHHEPLSSESDEPPDSARVALSFRGLAGYAPRSGLYLFDYLDPALDEGEDRAEAVATQLRLAQVEAFGSEWPPEVAQAVREGQVLAGMTTRQVEVSWGWPTQVERGPAGGQRWIYERQGTHLRQVYRPPLGYYGPQPQLGPAWGYDSGWVMVRERFVERRIVTLGGEGKVVSVEVIRSER